MFGCCCCCQRKVGDTSDPVFVEGKDRKCTDVFCLILFIAFWIGMLVIAIIGFAEGDPDNLLYGTDYAGRTCGSEGLGKRIYYPRITEDLLDAGFNSDLTDPLDVTLFGICVEECPQAGQIACTEAGEAALPGAKAHVGTLDALVALAECQKVSNWLNSDCTDVRGNCWSVPLNTTEFFFRCVWVRERYTTTVETCQSPPSLAGVVKGTVSSAVWDQCVTKTTDFREVTTGEAQSNPLLELIYRSAELFGRIVSDVEKAMPVILVCGGVLSFLLGFLWLVFIKCCAGFMVWLTILLTVLVSLAVTLLGYAKAGILTADQFDNAVSTFNSRTGASVSTEYPDELEKGDEDEQKRWRYFAYVMTGVTIILLVLIMWARKSIRIAIGIIKEGSDALRSMKALLLYPVVTVLALILLIAYWIIVAAYVASTGDEITENATLTSIQNAARAPNLLCAINSTGQPDQTKCDELAAAAEYDPDDVKRYLLAYHLFGLLWTNQFIEAIGIMIISGSISRWYFTMDKAKSLPRFPCCGSTKRTFRYHLGTVAFGSLIIAIVQAIRLTLEYLDRKTKTMQDKSKFWAFVMKCVKCCLWCFEKCLQFITKYAFIIVAMKGKSFCTAARQAVMMIIANAKQIAVVETITTFLFFLGKVFIVSFSGLCALAWFEKADNYQEGEKDELDSVIVPMGLVLILSFAVATTFLNVYKLTIDTILLCFCEDRSKHAGTPEDPYFMSDRLKKIIGASTAKAVQDEEDLADDGVGDPYKDPNQGGYGTEDGGGYGGANESAGYGTGGGAGAGMGGEVGGYGASASAGGGTSAGYGGPTASVPADAGYGTVQPPGVVEPAATTGGY